MKSFIFGIVLTILLMGMFGTTVLVASSKKPRQHVFHTYYGDIDTDTMKVALREEDNSPCYLVHVIERDSFIWNGVVKYLNCPEKFYYCPSKNTYIMGFPDNHGVETFVDWDPNKDYLDWLKN